MEAFFCANYWTYCYLLVTIFCFFRACLELWTRPSRDSAQRRRHCWHFRLMAPIIGRFDHRLLNDDCLTSWPWLTVIWLVTCLLCLVELPPKSQKWITCNCIHLTTVNHYAFINGYILPAFFLIIFLFFFFNQRWSSSCFGYFSPAVGLTHLDFVCFCIKEWLNAWI